MTSLFPGFLATAVGFFAVGCGCGGPTSFESVSLTTSSVSATRAPSVCGVPGPPFNLADEYTLKVVGKVTVPAPYNTLTVTLRNTPDSTVAVPLEVPMPPTAQGEEPPSIQTAQSSDSNITFSFARGSDATEVDDSFLSSVVVAVVTLPAVDGEDLSVSLQLNFSDGNELDAVYSAKVTTVASACPTGG